MIGGRFFEREGIQLRANFRKAQQEIGRAFACSQHVKNMISRTSIIFECFDLRGTAPTIDAGGVQLSDFDVFQALIICCFDLYVGPPPRLTLEAYQVRHICTCT